MQFLFRLIFLIVFVVASSLSCYSYAGESIPTDEQVLLSIDEKNLLGVNITKYIPKCYFLNTDPSSNSEDPNEKAIFDCIESATMSELSVKLYDRLPDNFDILDGYLGDKVMPYVLKLDKKNQAIFMQRIARWHSVSIKFIKSLLDNEIPSHLVTLQMIGYGGGFWAECSAYELFIERNIKLYENKETLYEPVTDMDWHTPLYRSRDLDFLTLCSSNVCSSVIKTLAEASPELLNIKGDFYGATPLTNVTACEGYMKQLSVEEIKSLATPENINMQDNSGNTALHEITSSYDAILSHGKHSALSDDDRKLMKKYKRIIDWLSKQEGIDVEVADQPKVPTEMGREKRQSIIVQY